MCCRLKRAVSISTMGEAFMTEEIVKEISLKDISKKLEEFAQARDWEKYHSPRNLLLAMVCFFDVLSCYQFVLWYLKRFLLYLI